MIAETDVARQRREGVCPICSQPATAIGIKRGRWRPRDYHLARCAGCAFGFITDPDTDFAAIYNADYYRGKGADPLVHYDDEITAPTESSRAYELAGLYTYAQSSIALRPQDRWLDFGSGLGGFVAYLRAAGVEAHGFDEGYAATEAARRGVPMLSRDDLETAIDSFSVVSAIEVLEHVIDPIDTMRNIAALLRPGGLFLYTTGNAAPFRAQLPKWSYVVPEIHISFYEPATMNALFRKVGLVPLERTGTAFPSDIIRYKIMKNLGLSRRSLLDSILPWPILSGIADWRYQISSMILAVKPDQPG